MPKPLRTGTRTHSPRSDAHRTSHGREELQGTGGRRTHRHHRRRGACLFCIVFASRKNTCLQSATRLDGARNLNVVCLRPPISLGLIFHRFPGLLRISPPLEQYTHMQDTVTGFLLAGVGQKDAKGSNFLVVKEGGMCPAVLISMSLSLCVFVCLCVSVSVCPCLACFACNCGRMLPR